MKKILFFFLFLYCSLSTQAKPSIKIEQEYFPQRLAKKYPKTWFAKDIAIGVLSTGFIGFTMWVVLPYPLRDLMSTIRFDDESVPSSIVRNLNYLSIPFILITNAYMIKKGYDQYQLNKKALINKVRDKTHLSQKWSKKDIIIAISCASFSLIQLGLIATLLHGNDCRRSFKCARNWFVSLSALTWALLGFYSIRK